MSWIKEYSKSASNLFKGQVLEGMQPLDFFHFFPLWYDLWIARVAEVIRKLDLDTKHYNEIKDILPVPSNIRTIIIKIITSYCANPANNKDDYKLFINFLARLLKECCPDDPYSLISNPLHSEDEINKILDELNFESADADSARKIGQLITSAGSLVHGLYNDVVTDFGWDAYGPYSIRSNQTLLIRHFPNLQPNVIWTKNYLASVKELYIYSVYENVDWEISFLGCHTVSKGESPINGMKNFAVYADGRLLSIEEINKLIEEFSVKATEIYQNIRKMNFEQIKSMVINQECYQLKKLFDEADINWLPTDQMKERINNKPLMKNIFPYGHLIKTTEEFKRIFGINKFEKEILSNKTV